MQRNNDLSSYNKLLKKLNQASNQVDSHLKTALDRATTNLAALLAADKVSIDTKQYRFISLKLNNFKEPVDANLTNCAALQSVYTKAGLIPRHENDQNESSIDVRNARIRSIL